MNSVTKWLSREMKPPGTRLSDFGQMRGHLRPADVILVEGRTRVAGIIQAVTLSSWTHAALYLGRPRDLADPDLATFLCDQLQFAPDEQLILEAEIGKGVIVSSLTRYSQEHLRLCRPSALTTQDAQAVIAYALARLGMPYDVRHIFDLLRFFFPYGLLPRYWRSSLFEAHSGEIVRTICSTLLAEAFSSVHYPILPRVLPGGDGELIFHELDARLHTPRDFDYSPYFDIVKYPFYSEDAMSYRDLRWDDQATGDACEGSESD